jgi:hypothetical protein
MTKDIDFFLAELEKQFKKNKRMKNSNIPYGSNVMPILELYKSLSDFPEKEAFLNALEKILGDPNEERRHFGVLVCLGFFVFRDSI